VSESHGAKALSLEEVTVPDGHFLNKLWKICAGVGLVSLLASIVLGAFVYDWQQFAFSYHVAWLFFLTIALGGLFFTLIHFASKAGWSVTVRRIPEAAMSALPMLAVLFLPTLALLDQLFFHWAGSHGPDELVAKKEPYLNVGFFVVRAVLYLTVWSLLAWYFYKRSLKQDVDGDKKTTLTLQNASYPALIAFALTVTYASFDWLMSLEPHWFSTIFGVYFFAGSTVAIFAFTSVSMIALHKMGLLKGVITEEHYHDVGKLLFAFVVFWAYIGFSQYMLIWYANVPEETTWFLQRSVEGWQTVSIVIAVGHFAVPFFFLMSRHIKRNAKTLLAGAIWMLVLHLVDLFWIAMPTLQVHQMEHGGAHANNIYEGHFGVHLLDLTTLLGVGGLFLAVVIFRLCSNALVPRRDPRLPESLAFENF
jgi:hypothetical protein